MEGLYLVSIPNEVLAQEHEGVSKKIKSHITSLNKKGLATELYSFQPSRNIVRKVMRQLPYNLFISSYKYYERLNSVDFIYIRKMAFDYSFLRLLKNIKKRNPECKIILEIPTYPYDNEISKLIHVPGIIKDRYNRKKLFKFVDRIVTFSDDEEIFGIKTLRLSNGVDTELIKQRIPLVRKENNINLIAVAMHSFWHGYDRFLEGMGRYYEKGGKRNIFLHIVGEGDGVFNKYREIINKYSLQDRVIFHGKRHGEELDQIYNKCNMALDSMGRHRSGVYYNSSLKGKEYAAKGLPVVSGVRTELDDVLDFEYYLRVPADETPINIEEIIKFYDEIYQLEEKEVIGEIRRYAEEHFDMDICFDPVVDYLKS
ncbi:glycosyltransferase [Priestia endophytica]|uniref:Glycosyltransferase involved in cell wall bisynthesis n=1 Tax=Priestia endophytica DSM 13796 TaxID=1121089 RepID=A0A1I5V805_9BACI|nr:glycosyltransferase [Priestia endophytica]KYG35615.1 hypothetical protein AZF06_00020 [Priestia endophytica]SFQ03635.1 Glycosyltransferase involved in cell wall bisynthesis [Priestia endophytica DSM 13796]